MAVAQPRTGALAGPLDSEAGRQPATYRLRVFLLGLLGYGYIVGVLALLAGAITGTVYLAAGTRGSRVWAAKLVFALGALAFVVLRALWVRLDPPGGVTLGRQEAPALFEAIETIRKRSRAPRVHRVLLTSDFNAAVSQVPRLGLLGWPRNYLVLGLPLMQALSPAQFRAVLAHEFGHLSGAHSRLSGWVYRLRESWERIVTALADSEHWGAIAFAPFFRWYVPLFDRVSFALRRAQEYEADRNSVRLTSAADAAAALVTLAVRARWLEERYWKGVYDRAATDAEPSAAPHAEMGRALGEGLPADLGREALDGALRATTDEHDTHPSLAARLAAIGQRAALPAPAAESAAEHYLRSRLPPLARTLDEAWRAGVRQAWRERHQALGEMRAGLAAFAGRADLTPEEEWNRARWTEEVAGAGPARPLYEALAARHPGHLAALFAAGRLRLEAGDDSGVAMIERVMTADADAVLPGCRLVYRFLTGRGREAEAEPYRTRAIARAEFLEASRHERATVRAGDRFLPHGLPAEAVAALAERIGRERRVARAYLARKAVEHCPEQPLYVLGVVARGLVFREASVHAVAADLSRTLDLPGETLVVALVGDNARFRRPLGKVAGAEVYRR